MINLVAFDLDGTLAPSKETLEDETAILLSELTQFAKVAVISGGSYEQFKKQFIPTWIKLKLEKDFEKLVLLPVNGSQCYVYNEKEKDWKIVYQKKFPLALKVKVMKELNNIIKSPKFKIPKLSEIEGDYIEDRGTQITFSALGQDASLKNKLKWDAHQKKRLRIKEELDCRLSGVEVVVAGTTSIDILPKGENKAAGLKLLLKKLKIKNKNILFVGDAVFPGGNDYSPFEEGMKTVKVSGPEATRYLIQNLIKGYHFKI